MNAARSQKLSSHSAAPASLGHGPTAATAELCAVNLLASLAIVLAVDGRKSWSLLRQQRHLGAFAAAVVDELCGLAVTAPPRAAARGPAQTARADAAGKARLLALLQCRVRVSVQSYAAAAAAPAAREPAGGGAATGTARGPEHHAHAAKRGHRQLPPSLAAPPSAIERLLAIEAAAAEAPAPPLRAGELSANPGVPLLVAVVGLACLGPGERASGAGGTGVDAAAILQQVATRTTLQQQQQQQQQAGGGGAGGGLHGDGGASGPGEDDGAGPAESFAFAAQAAAIDALGPRRAAELAAALREAPLLPALGAAALATPGRLPAPLEEGVARFALAAMRRESLRVGGTLAVLPAPVPTPSGGGAIGAERVCASPWHRLLDALLWLCDDGVWEAAAAQHGAGDRRRLGGGDALLPLLRRQLRWGSDESSPAMLFIPAGHDSAALICDALLAARWGLPPAPSASESEDAAADARLAAALSDEEFARALPPPPLPRASLTGEGGTEGSDAAPAWWLSEAAMISAHIGGPSAASAPADAYGLPMGAWLLQQAEKHRDSSAAAGGAGAAGGGGGAWGATAQPAAAAPVPAPSAAAPVPTVPTRRSSRATAAPAPTAAGAATAADPKAFFQGLLASKAGKKSAR